MPDTDREILNMEEAAQLFNVSVKTFIKLLKEEKVPARKIGREWRFSRKALIDWLSAGNSQDYSSSEGETKEFFDSIAPEWEKIRKSIYDESVKDYLLGLDAFKADMTVADLGCGDGYLSLAVADRVKKVIAVDLSSKMLQELRNKAASRNILNIEAIEGNAVDLPLDDNIADVVCSNMLLHHIDDPNIVIGEIYRILKTGGMVFAADLARHTNHEFSRSMHDTWNGFTVSEMETWFKSNGFAKIKIDRLTQDDPKYPAILVITAYKK